MIRIFFKLGLKLTTSLLILLSVFACIKQHQPTSSRYYNNPYALPPQNYALPPQNRYPYYDYDNDRYYVPPIGYGLGRSDGSFTNPSDQKF